MNLSMNNDSSRSMDLIHKSVVATIIIILFAVCALAEEVIDFERAMELALENNRQLKMLKQDNRYAEFQVKEAYSGAMPQVSAMGSYSRNIMIPTLETDFVMNGQPMSFRMQMGRENNYYGEIRLQQPLWIAGKIGIAIEIAKIYKQISEKNVHRGEKELRYLVTRSFYGVLMAQEFEDLMVSAEQQIKSHLENARVMHQQGLVSEYDLLRAEVELANFHPNVTAAKEAYDMALEGLRILLGL